MKNPLWLTLLFAAFLSLEMLYGQESELTEEDKKIINEKYFGNEDYWRARKIFKAGQKEESRKILEQVTETFYNESNFEAFAKAGRLLIEIYYAESAMEKAVQFGEAAVEKLTENSENGLRYTHFLHGELGRVLMFNYNYEDSYRHFEAAAKVLEEFSLGYSDSLKLAYVYNRWGNLCSYFRNFEKAEWCFNQTITLAKLLPYRILEGHANTNFGTLWRRKGNLEKGIEYMHRGLEIVSEELPSNSLRLIGNYYSIGTAYSGLGESEKSTDNFLKIVRLIEKSETTSDYYLKQVVPECLINVGYNFLEGTKYSEASEYFEKSVSILESASEENPYYLNLALIGWGTTLFKNNAIAKAEEVFQRANSGINNFLKKDDYRGRFLKHKLLFKQANCYASTDDYEKAIRFFKASIDFPLSDHSDDFVIVSQTNNLIADNFAALDQLDSALVYNNIGLRYLSQSYKYSDILDLPALKNLQNERIVYHVLLSRAEILQAFANEGTEDSEKRRSILEAAIEVIDLADEFHEENLTKINLLRGAESKSIVQYSIPHYLKGIEILNDSEYKKADRIEKGLYYTQKLKSQQLWLTQLNSEAKRIGKIDPKLLEEERDLVSEINLWEKELLKAEEADDSTTIISVKNDRLFVLNGKLNAVKRKMEKNHPEYYESKYAFMPETGSSLKELLKEDEIIIEYVAADSFLFAFTIAQDQPIEQIKIPINSNSESNINELNQMLRNSAMMRKSSREKFVNLSCELYRQLLQPFENQFFNKKRLMIIGDGMINYLPFEVLLKSNEIKPFKELDFLIKRHEISYHYSSGLFAKAKRKAAANHSGIYAFAPVYDEVNSKDYTVEESVNTEFNSTLRAYKNDGRFSPLPESEKEVKSIIKLFNKKEESSKNKLDLRENATEASLKSNLEKSYQFVHIAGHSFADLENPKFSGIACFEERDSEQEDGTLYTGEIYNISSTADLVTLSSCESGFGKLDYSEGILGLNRAFIYAGTPNVVFSLWKVYDKVSAKLMVDFYKNVLEGKDYSESLRTAKLNLLNNEATAAPHFWSPYLLIGR